MRAVVSLFVRIVSAANIRAGLTSWEAERRQPSRCRGIREAGRPALPRGAKSSEDSNRREAVYAAAAPFRAFI